MGNLKTMCAMKERTREVELYACNGQICQKLGLSPCYTKNMFVHLQVMKLN